MKQYVIFLTSLARKIFTYTGIAGNWTDGTKWQGGVSPLTGSTNTGVTIASAVTVSLNNNATINQLKFNSSSTLSTATANTLTIDGSGALITSNGTSVSGTITCPVTFANGTSFLTNNGFISFGTGVTASNKNFTLTATTANSTGNVRFNTAGNTGITGGTFTINSGYLSIAGTGLNGASGPSIILKNNGAIDSNLLIPTATTVANNIVFSDTGTRIFGLSSTTGTGVFSGTVTGSITHDLAFSGELTGNWSGFSTTANIYPTVAAINTSTFPTNKISIGYLGGTFSTRTNQNLTNDFDFILPSGVTTAGGITLQGTSQTLSGNILIDKNGVAGAGSAVTLTNSGTNPATFSGVISKNGTAANTTLQIAGTQTIRFTNTHTYTNPTAINNAELQVNGTIVSNVTVNSNNGRLSGKGTVGAITCVSASTASIHAYSKDNSPSVTDVLTANGNVIFQGTTNKFNVFTSATASSKLAINGNVTFSAGVAVVIATGSTALTSGNSAVIMTYTGTSSGTLAPPVGYTISDVAGVVTLTKT